jgi:SAM-dependent methyltransferase
MPSYSSVHASLADRWKEFRHLYRFHKAEVPHRMQHFVQRMREIEQWIERETGVVIRDMRVLDVGCGQHMRQARYFACRNDVDAIDYDIVPQGFDVPAYASMLRQNGAIRTAKTLARKVAGVDRRYRAALRQALEVNRLPPVCYQQMDATQLKFADATFDAVFSSAVWMHLPDPAAANLEVARVLKPGGLVFHSIHLYTHDSGAHDPRVFSTERSDLPYWAHLRPSQAHLARPNTFQNKLRLSEWRDLFNTQMPGCHFELRQYASERLRPELDRIRAAGELAEYSDDELLTVDLWVVWRNPSAGITTENTKTTEKGKGAGIGKPNHASVSSVSSVISVVNSPGAKR